MAKKKVTAAKKSAKELAWESFLNMSGENRILRCPSPKYTYKEGDRVQVGNFSNCQVNQVLEDGKVYYCIEYGEEYPRYGYWMWYEVKPVPTSMEYELANNDSVLCRMNHTNRSIESLLHMVYFFGMDFNPPYQRGFVWDREDMEKLMDSIFNGRGIGLFVIRNRDWETTEKDEQHNTYEVVDGAQRLNTILRYYENRFPYRGKYFNDLSAMDRNWFLNQMTSVAELPEATTDAETLQVFLALNTNCKHVSDEVLNRAREMLEKENNYGRGRKQQQNGSEGCL